MPNPKDGLLCLSHDLLGQLSGGTQHTPDGRRFPTLGLENRTSGHVTFPLIIDESTTPLSCRKATIHDE